MTARRPGVETPEEVPPWFVGQPLGAPGGTSHWLDPRHTTAGTWTHTATRSGLRLTRLGAVVVCLLLAVGFLLAQHAGRALMCKTHPHGPPRYCASYQQTEPAR